MGLDDSIVFINGCYSLSHKHIQTDNDCFDIFWKGFQKEKNLLSAEIILSLYKGECLADFEAHWAISKRIKYCSAYEEVLKYVKEMSLETNIIPVSQKPKGQKGASA
jgi:two-component SAPR family response regulator